MGTFPPNKVKHYLVPVGIKTIIRDNNGNVKDILTGDTVCSTPKPNNFISSTNITVIQQLTAAEWEALTPKPNNTVMTIIVN